MSKKRTTVNETIEGVYTFWDNELLDNPNIIGYLALYSGNYYFTYLNYNELSKQAIETASKFYFTNTKSGKYSLNYQDHIKANVAVNKYDNNEILATINFTSDDEENKANKSFLIRTNKKKKNVYFHSMVSELQLWNISKPWKNNGISKKEAVKIADMEAEHELERVNNSDFAKDFNYKFKVEDYNKKIGLITSTDELYWYILYLYTFKHAAKDEMHFAGHPAHFTIRVNQKSAKTQLLHGE